MLTEERHSIITDTVNTRKSVTIAELCRILDVSASTVKRDLNILAEAGKITKVRGGAISLDESFSAVEKNVEEKSAICTEEKTAIAAYAASLVENGDFIFLDAGTTNGISLTAGFTTPDVNEARVKSAAMESSRRSYILADHSKFDEISSATFAQLGKANIITDRLSNRKYAEYTSIKEVM